MPNFYARRKTLKWDNENLRGRLSRSISSASFICRSHHPNTWIGNANTAESIIEIFTSEKGKGHVTKSDAKIPIRLRPPPPHFRKIMLQFFYDRYGCIYERRYDGQIVWNACTLEPSSKWVLFWFFSIQLLKKRTLNPEITILYQFHDQKNLFNVPKICNIIFWIENDPSPPKSLFQKFIRFGHTLP